MTHSQEAPEDGGPTPGGRDEPSLQAVLEALDSPAVITGRAGEVLCANRAAAALFGISAAALEGLPAESWAALQSEHFVPEDAAGPGGEADATRLRSAGYPRRYYRRERRRLVEPGGVEAGYMELLRDITGEVRGEEEAERLKLSHSREMEALEARMKQVEKFKMDLTANVTHDLRTPLASIKASVSGLLAGDVAYDPQALRETLLLIEDETDRLQRRVQNLLSLASMESGGAHMNRDWVDLPDVVASALESLRSVRGQREVRVQFPEDLPFVLGDYDQLQIAIRNLVENAFLYTPEDTPIEVSATANLGQVRLRVRDYGSGLMPDEAEQIFDKFYRGRSARRIPGTGLGLPICRGIAEAHGGRLWAEHVPGGGVAFVLSLPLEGDPEDALTQKDTDLTD